MEKRFIFCLILLLAVSLCLPAAAKSDYLQDAAGLLQNTERAELEAQLYAASARNSFDITVLLTDREFGDRAETVYRSNGYGKDQVYGGVLLVIDAKDKTLTFYTDLQGRFEVLTEDDIEELEERLHPYLQARDLYGLIWEYSVFCDDRVTRNRLDMPKPPELPLAWYYGVAVVAIGAVAALVVVIGRAARLKSVRLQPSAVNYLREDSLRVTEREEYFDR